VRSRLFALAAVMAAALVPVSLGSSARPRTTDPINFVDIQVKITDAKITVSPTSVERGIYGRFIVRNVGSKTHSFVLAAGTKKGTGIQTGFGRTVKPKSQKILLLFLDYRSVLHYSSTLPADRSKPGMKGTFHIV
jgi:hypothetical protein